eukprot:1908557-Prymnesium_polylepis.1
MSFGAHARGFRKARERLTTHLELDTSPGARCPDRCTPSRASSALSTLPSPVPKRTAPARAPRTCWGPG